MTDILRWGRSAYETDAALALEERAAVELGLSWSLREERADPGDLTGVRALVVPSKVRVTADVLRDFGGSLVLTTTSGHDHIDVAAARAGGVQVARCPLARRDPVVEHALSSAMFFMRRLPDLAAAGSSGVWARGQLDALGPRGLAGATVVVVGQGVIGRRMNALLATFGARVLAVDPRGVGEDARACTLDEALPQADLVTLHCSLTPSSRGLFSADKLALLPPHAVVVNTSRGEVLDVDAAVAAVRAGQLRGLSVDVFPEEPYPQMARAADLPQVLFTPHSCGYVHDLGLRVAREVGANLRAWHAGEELPGALAEDVLDGL